jgi:phytoene desaturase
MAEPYRKAIERRLEETVMPGLSQSIVTSRMMTPLDFRDRLNSWKGAAFSLEPKLFQSAWFRPHNVSEEVDGLYLVGAGTHPGAGIPGVISSAKGSGFCCAQRRRLRFFQAPVEPCPMVENEAYSRA